MSFHKNFSTTPPPRRVLPLLEKIKSAYLLWYSYYQILPKPHRHSLGQRIDTLFIETIEAISIAAFLARQEKQPYIRLAIRKVDTLNILLMILWETKSLENKKYAALSIKIIEIGKMLGGWSGQILKQNSPKTGEK
ncbi:MAG: four helix bundle protein [Candidatus Giovannonibacteria bacterium]|nr:MAG: four helix bundle protein [Candidatus Giovannonibacteria bacterium]